MTLNQINNGRIQAARQGIKRGLGNKWFQGVLGNRNGLIYVPGQPGYVFVRELLGADSAGNTVYGEAFPVIAGTGATYTVYVGAPVVCKWDDYEDAYVIDRSDREGLVNAGINPSVNNANNPYLQEVDLRRATLFKATAIATGTTASTEVAVFSLIYVDSKGERRYYSGSKIDLASSIPSAGEHRLALVWLQTDGTLAVSASAAKAQVLPLDVENDLEECLAAPPSARAVPNTAFRLYGDQTSVRASDEWIDIRQWVNAPGIKYNFTASAAPTVDDDDSDNYEVGSLWFDTTNDAIYACTDASTGAAIWNDLTDGGGAPDDATYIVQQPSASLSNEQALSALATGILKSTTSTGVVSIAAGSDLDSTHGSQVANHVYAAPDGSAGEPAFRALVSDDLPGTLASKTLTTPTIDDFTNATHDHQDDAGGGTLDAAAIDSGTLDNARVNWAEPDAIGGTTPAAGTFTDLVASASGVVGGYAKASDTDFEVRTDSGFASRIKLREDGDAFGFTVEYDGNIDDFVIRRHDNDATGVRVLGIARATGDIDIPGTDIIFGSYSSAGDRLLDIRVPSGDRASILTAEASADNGAEFGYDGIDNQFFVNMIDSGTPTRALSIGRSNATVIAEQDFRVDGDVGFYGVTPVSRRNYSAITGNERRVAWSTTTISLAELAEVVHAIVRDMNRVGLFEIS